MHLKTYSVDGSVLRTGSANLSHGGLLLQDNDLMVNRDSTIVAAFDHRFEDMWNSAEPIRDLTATKSR
jgi:phosphatidylserine/phosphatidylglycerophosphate/cardiolipin synthase-like enzyme